VRSRSRRVAAAAVLLFAALTCSAQQAPTGEFTRKEVTTAIEEIKKDPNLARERTISTLKWVKSREDEQKKRDLSWLKWLGELFGWLTENGRFLFWGVLAVLVGLLLVYLWRLVRGWSMPERSSRISAPSFVRDLDIRPESLPAQIGAAARQLWDQGEHRPALALLYRGLLSRLVHVHQVPIKDSSTEGDCLALANRHLKDEERKAYVSSLVTLWQRAVYGGEDVPTESVHALCAGFAGALDRPEVAPAPPDATANAGARA
jgi:uncharacterized protein DUF4129